MHFSHALALISILLDFVQAAHPDACSTAHRMCMTVGPQISPVHLLSIDSDGKNGCFSGYVVSAAAV